MFINSFLIKFTSRAETSQKRKRVVRTVEMPIRKLLVQLKRTKTADRAKEKRRFNCQCFLKSIEKLKQTDILFNKAL